MSAITYMLEKDEQDNYSISIREYGVPVVSEPFGNGPEARAMAEYSLRQLAGLGEVVDFNV